ncbi:MAG: hypothetical protein ABJH63_07095 [Rhizobiaceae bacterium]
MADYHAVLQRTLAGFKDPKPELRFKLYERARTTIARQLENRTPPVVGDALVAELDKLEYAIFEIEQVFDPAYPPPTPQAAAQQPAPAEVETAPAPAPENIAPVAEQAPEVAPELTPVEPSFSDTLAATPPAQDAPLGAADAIATPDTQPASPPIAPPIAQAPAGFEPLDPPSSVIDPAAASAENQAANDAAVDQWAEEFLANQPGQASQPQPPVATPPNPASIGEAPVVTDPAVAPLPAVDLDHSLPLPEELQQHPQVAPPVEPSWDAAIEPAPAAEAYQPSSQPISPPPASPPPPSQPIPPLPTFEPSQDAPAEDPLVIPPAPGFGNGGSKRPRKRKWLKWLLLLLVLILLGTGATYAWLNKEQILEQLGMSDLLDNPTRPKPVKTISITPEQVDPEAPLPTPKVESRLNSDGEEVATSPSSPSPSTDLQPVIETPSVAQNSDGSVPVAQNAILYEEGSSPAENTVDSGRVVWSVIEEEPASGAPKEAAIRARIEIPERNVVLIMKIKRNADKALPASHLIELVFAVPDDFSGGAINQVSRFVLKQSEQGRGEGLVGVPARIADGIFLIALNNLEQAKLKNESLLKSRAWIDIPLQYRTGRRALITIEKGVPGTKVFDEVFEAWAKL